MDHLSVDLYIQGQGLRTRLRTKLEFLKIKIFKKQQHSSKYAPTHLKLKKNFIQRAQGTMRPGYRILNCDGHSGWNQRKINIKIWQHKICWIENQMIRKWPSIEQLHFLPFCSGKLCMTIACQTYICLKIGCVRQEMLAKDECITICNVCECCSTSAPTCPIALCEALQGATVSASRCTSLQPDVGGCCLAELTRFQTFLVTLWKGGQFLFVSWAIVLKSDSPWLAVHLMVIEMLQRWENNSKTSFKKGQISENDGA